VKLLQFCNNFLGANYTSDTEENTRKALHFYGVMEAMDHCFRCKINKIICLDCLPHGYVTHSEQGPYFARLLRCGKCQLNLPCLHINWNPTYQLGEKNTQNKAPHVGSTQHLKFPQCRTYLFTNQKCKITSN